MAYSVANRRYSSDVISAQSLNIILEIVEQVRNNYVLIRFEGYNLK